MVDKTTIHQEWLAAYPAGRAQQWFFRELDQKTKKYQWKFSKYFKGHKQIVELTRNNVLFLSNAVKLNNEQLFPIFDWFQKDLMLLDAPSEKRDFNEESFLNQIKSPGGKHQILVYRKRSRYFDPDLFIIRF